MGYKIELHIQLTLSTAQPDEGSRKSGSAAFTLFKGGLESHVIKSRQALNNQIRISSTFKEFRPSFAHLSPDASIDLEWCSYHIS